MAEDRQIVIIEKPDNEPLELRLPKGFAKGEGWETGASYHMIATPRGYELVRDERAV